MTKKQKKDFINKINDFFVNAKNHGGRNNWWYPKQNVIAYNVKLHGMTKDIEDLREILSKRQNEYYSDDTLYDIMQRRQEHDANFYAEDLKDTHTLIKDAYYAGRSGGWLEVEYYNGLGEVDSDTSTGRINALYPCAKELETLESEIAERIKKDLEGYMEYINSNQYLEDIKEQLLSDEDIAEEYKKQINKLTSKLK